MTLLEKAKLDHKNKYVRITDDHVELALAWGRDEINFAQVSRALAGKGTQVYCTLARSFRAAIERGKLK